MRCKYGTVMWCTSWICKGYQLAAAYCMRSSYALQVRHATQHGSAKCTSLQLYGACTIAMRCKYGMVMWCTSWICKGYQRAAAYCMRSSYALQVRHATQHGSAKCTSLQLYGACTLAMRCKYGTVMWCTSCICKG
jgi:hypothetical protein